jgi:hypothetical protein
MEWKALIEETSALLAGGSQLSSFGCHHNSSAVIKNVPLVQTFHRTPIFLCLSRATEVD